MTHNLPILARTACGCNACGLAFTWNRCTQLSEDPLPDHGRCFLSGLQVTAPFSLLQYHVDNKPKKLQLLQACRADASYPQPSSCANLYTYASSLAATDTYHQQTCKLTQACDSSLVCSARLTLPVCKHILVGAYDVPSSTEQKNLIFRQQNFAHYTST